MAASTSRLHAPAGVTMPQSPSLPAIPNSTSSSPDRYGHSNNEGHHHSVVEKNNAKHLISNLTVKGGKGTWHSVHKNEWDVDRPARRADIEGLAFGFQLAMMVVDENQSFDTANKTHHNKGPASGDDTGALVSSLENDLLAVKAEVSGLVARVSNRRA